LTRAPIGDKSQDWIGRCSLRPVKENIIFPVEIRVFKLYHIRYNKMALARKTLILANDFIIIEMVDGQDRNGAAAIQYFTGGGTVVMEVTNDDAILAGQVINANAVWVTKTDLIDQAGATGKASIAAAGYVRGEIVGFRFVRARLSVAAGANTDVALNVKIN
jgi:hypothetical protein